MARRSCDGTGLLDAFRAAVGNLEAHVEEINGLNVYPVPDGDTGSNMYATVKAALDEAEAVAGQPADRVAAAISFGALMGARGNSGVITSQIFRGMAEALSGKKRFNGLDLAHALTEGARTAYSAVAKPVEGTIREVAASADPVTRTFQVKVSLDAKAQLALGTTVTVVPQALSMAGAPAIKLPTSALRQEGQGTAVWVLDTATMTVKSQPVQLAAADGNVVTMDHLIHATKREFQKMGKVVTEAEFRDARWKVADSPTAR